MKNKMLCTLIVASMLVLAGCNKQEAPAEPVEEVSEEAEATEEETGEFEEAEETEEYEETECESMSTKLWSMSTKLCKSFYSVLDFSLAL